MMNHAAKIWEETVLLPTYPAAEPEKYPLFIEKRAYQGSTGKVYPLPVTEKVSDVCREVAYHAVWLENEYLRVMVLPELGGRIHRALDKTNGYDFVYYNHVVKPALVGLTGPWISGGIEFNWPQHHRPTTFSPVDYRVAEHDDGSVTVYVGETDKMYGTKGMAAISLYPGKAYLEIRGRLYNPAADLPVVGQPRGAGQRSHLLGLSARRERRHGPRQARGLDLPDCDRRILQVRLLGGGGHLALQERAGPDLLHGGPLGL